VDQAQPRSVLVSVRGARFAVDAPMQWLPHALLATSLLITFLQPGGTWNDNALGWVVGLTVVAAAWTVIMLGRGYPVHEHQRRLGIYFVGRTLLAAALVVLAPWYGVYSWFGWNESIRYFPGLRRGYPAIVATAVVTSFSYVGGVPSSAGGWLVYAIALIGVSVLVSFFRVVADRSFQRDQEREEALRQLQVANERLANALAENRGLQEQLMTQAREAGVLDERARLAGEIHDTLAQALTGIITQLEAADRGGELRSANGHVDSHVASARALARSGLAEARRSLHALRPTPLVGSQLAEAISDAASRWTTSSKITAQVEVVGDVLALDTDVEVALLRVAQEGLANIEKHARATKVAVTLSYLDDVVLLDVHDDGVGFVAHEVRPGSDGTAVGLSTMRERLRRVGGDLEIESEPAGGTTLVARVPVR
jgi:signal transduction histidine kinase